MPWSCTIVHDINWVAIRWISLNIFPRYPSAESHFLARGGLCRYYNLELELNNKQVVIRKIYHTQIHFLGHCIGSFLQRSMRIQNEERKSFDALNVSNGPNLGTIKGAARQGQPSLANNQPKSPRFISVGQDRVDLGRLNLFRIAASEGADFVFVIPDLFFC